MAQNASQIPITPPLPGLQLVQDINKAIETIASDFAGSNDPAAIAWPLAVWADTGTQTIKRRNATNDAWVIEGSLLQRHLIALTLAQITSLAADQGPVICSDSRVSRVWAWSALAMKYTPDFQPNVSLTATFTRVDNKIVAGSIVTMLGLEVGDVINVSGTASNNNIYTVEQINDVSTIIVNYEHRNGTGVKTLTNETISATFTMLVKSYNAALGLGQDWVNVTPSRTIGALYTNTTSRTIGVMANVSGTSGLQRAFVRPAGGVPYFGNTDTGSGSTSMATGWTLVPSGGTYKIDSLDGTTKEIRELR